jgi:uncharacterized protein YkwD
MRQRRRLAVGALAALSCAAGLTAGAAPAAAPDAHDRPTRANTAAVTIEVGTTRLKALERKVLRRLNAYSASNGRKAVRTQKQLRRAALAHARAMATRGFFSHDSANGDSFDTRIKRYYGVGGFRSWSVGENLLWASGQLSAKRAIRLWHDSPGHRRNMRDGTWRQIGVAAVRVRSAPGVFSGLDVTIVVTDFGARR